MTKARQEEGSRCPPQVKGIAGGNQRVGPGSLNRKRGKKIKKKKKDPQALASEVKEANKLKRN